MWASQSVALYSGAAVQFSGRVPDSCHPHYPGFLALEQCASGESASHNNVYIKDEKGKRRPVRRRMACAPRLVTTLGPQSFRNACAVR